MTADEPGTAPTAAGIDLRDSPGLIAPRGHYSHVAVHAGVAHISGWLPLDAAYARWIGAHRPSRAVACVAELHHGAAIEIRAVAAVGPGQ